jgi:phosphopantothenoylcysteine decarboxylase
MHFIGSQSFALKESVELLWDKDEWDLWRKRGDPVLHIDLRNWADILLVAPLDANTLAKVANGLCDNLLTCVVRAWDLHNKPVVICPAMNTQMWNHPLTGKHLTICQRDFGFHIVQPVEKVLICGEVGMGAMAPVEEIVTTVVNVIL